MVAKQRARPGRREAPGRDKAASSSSFTHPPCPETYLKSYIHINAHNIPIFSDRVLWEWYISILTKASALHCTTVWPVEPSRKRARQEAGLYGVVAVQWLLMFYFILYIMVGIMPFGRYGRYATFGLILFWWVVFLRTRHACLLRLPRTRYSLYFRTEWYARINITYYNLSYPFIDPLYPLQSSPHHPVCPLLPLRNPGYLIECVQSGASWPYEKTQLWPFFVYTFSFRYILLWYYFP